MLYEVRVLDTGNVSPNALVLDDSEYDPDTTSQGQLAKPIR